MRNKVREKALQLKKKYSTNNPFELCDYLNIKVMFEDLGNINGFYQSAPKNKIIHINKNLDYHSQVITCGHELGHALFHSKLNILFLERNTFMIKNKFESEANYFMIELIVDNDIFTKEEFENMTIEQIATSINMPVELLKLKF